MVFKIFQMSKRSTRMKSKHFEISLILVMFDSGDIVRLNRLEKREYLCNPNNKIFLMVSGYLTKRRDVRKSKFRRIALNPLTRACYKIKSKRKFPASGCLSIATMRIGKRIRIRESIINKVLEDGQNELGEICN